MYQYLKKMCKLSGLKLKILVIFVFISLSSALTSVGFSMTIQPLLDRSLENQSLVFDILIKFIIFAILMSLFKAFRLKIFDFSAIKTEYRLSKLIMEKNKTLELGYFENKKEGELAYFLQNRIEDFANFLEDNISNIFYLPIYFISTFIGMIVVDYRISFVIIPTIFLGVFLDFTYTNKFLKSANDFYEEEKNLVSFQKELIEEEEKVRIEDLENYLIDRHDKKIDRLVGKENKLIKSSQIAYIPALINEYLPTIILIFVVIFKFATGEVISYGKFLTLLSLTSNVSLPFADYLRSLTSLKKINPLMDELIEVTDIKEQEEIIYKESENLLELRDVSFFYGNKPILDKINLNIKRGEKIGIIGESGVGKSTILKLILGIYMPSSGQINLFNMSTLGNKKEIWKKIAYLDNRNFILDGNILYNIFLKNKPTSDKKMKELKNISSKLGMDDILSLRKDKLREFGEDLSGGQKTKISIARALLKEEAKLLILDEPSAAMDIKSEKGLKELLEKLDKTIILTSHRKDLLTCCDRIYKLENKILKEVGSDE